MRTQEAQQAARRRLEIEIRLGAASLLAAAQLPAEASRVEPTEARRLLRAKPKLHLNSICASRLANDRRKGVAKKAAGSGVVGRKVPF